jgi:hypothetical protein
MTATPIFFPNTVTQPGIYGYAAGSEIYHHSLQSNIPLDFSIRASYKTLDG